MEAMMHSDCHPVDSVHRSTMPKTTIDPVGEPLPGLRSLSGAALSGRGTCSSRVAALKEIWIRMTHQLGGWY